MLCCQGFFVQPLGDCLARELPTRLLSVCPPAIPAAPADSSARLLMHPLLCDAVSWQSSSQQSGHFVRLPRKHGAGCELRACESKQSSGLTFPG